MFQGWGERTFKGTGCPCKSAVGCVSRREQSSRRGHPGTPGTRCAWGAHQSLVSVAGVGKIARKEQNNAMLLYVCCEWALRSKVLLLLVLFCFCFFPHIGPLILPWIACFCRGLCRLSVCAHPEVHADVEAHPSV